MPEFCLFNYDNLTLQVLDEFILLNWRIYPRELLLGVTACKTYRDGNPSILITGCNAMFFDCLRSAWLQVDFDKIKMRLVSLTEVFSSTLLQICGPQVNPAAILKQFNSPLILSCTHMLQELCGQRCRIYWCCLLWRTARWRQSLWFQTFNREILERSRFCNTVSWVLIIINVFWE